MQITIYVRDELLKEIDKRAKKAGCNRSEFLVRSALSDQPTLTKGQRRQIASELADFVRCELFGGV